MQNILVIGAGRSSLILIRYLLENASQNDWFVTVGDYNQELAYKVVENHNYGNAIFFDVNNSSQRSSEIKKTDIVISMLPSNMHYLIAQECVRLSKNLVTASYVSSEVQSLNEQAKKKGIILLNEVGLDPGIDHMSAMKMIDGIKKKEGVITSFKSFCGGLVHPDYDNNPWNYKFTWNPRNVVLAGMEEAKFLDNGNVKKLSYQDVFNNIEKISIAGLGIFEGYPNRDSLHYQEVYGLENISSLLRGTLRKEGFCKSWNSLIRLGITNDEEIIENVDNLTYRQYTSLFLEGDTNLDLEDRFCRNLDILKNEKEFRKMEWLGLFSEEKITLSNTTSSQVLQHLLEKKWALDKEDKDMVVMQHQLEYILKDSRKKIHSSLVVYGEDSQNTAMAKTVGLPIAIATKLILQRKIDLTGVQIPIHKKIYDPILKELVSLGISFIEDSFN